MSVQPIFILSLPRAGSTLLQRLLSMTNEISTSPEPWIALPLLSVLHEGETSSVYGHRAMVNAISGFVHELPHAEEDYFQQAGKFLLSLYELNAADNSRYFIDKTPRYHLIIDELMQAFPEGKFIFLWRNPLSIPASMIETWGKGKWNLFMFYVDLYRGFDSLLAGYKKYAHRSIALRYEDLVVKPEESLAAVLNYLELDVPNNLAEKLHHIKKIESPGRGDPTGQSKYQGISSKSTDTWKTVYANPFRKAWARKYIEWIGQEALDLMGYDEADLLSGLSKKSSYRLWLSDMIRTIYGEYIYRPSPLRSIRNDKRYENVPFIKN